MDANLFVAIVSLAASLIVGAMMAMHPEWRRVGWGVVALSLAVLFYSGALFAVAPRTPADQLRHWFAMAAAAVGAVLGLLGLVYDLSVKPVPEAKGAQLRLQFYGDARWPTAIRQTNIAFWFAYKSPHAEVRSAGVDGAPDQVLAKVNGGWAIFIGFDRPTEVSQIVAGFNAAGFPRYQVLQSTKRGCLVSVEGDIPAGELEIDVRLIHS